MRFEEGAGPFANYSHLVTEAFQAPVMRINETGRQHLSDSILADVLLRDRPEPTPPELSPDEEFARDLFQDLMQLRRAYEDLLDYEVYVRRFPYSKTRVTRTRHLYSVVAGYLQAVYVFKERLKRHLAVLKRLYRPTRLSRPVGNRVDSMRELVESVLDNLSKLRGRHVHDREVTDPELDVVESLDFMLRSVGMGELEEAATYSADHRFRQVRKKWLSTIQSNNKTLLPVLDAVFGKMLEVVAPAGVLLYPGEHK